MMTDLLGPPGPQPWCSRDAAFHQVGQGALHCHRLNPKRLPQLPDVPTVAEQGFPGFEMTQWYGMLARPTCRSQPRKALGPKP